MDASTLFDNSGNIFSSLMDIIMVQFNFQKHIEQTLKVAGRVLLVIFLLLTLPTLCFTTGMVQYWTLYSLIMPTMEFNVPAYFDYTSPTPLANVNLLGEQWSFDTIGDSNFTLPTTQLRSQLLENGEAYNVFLDLIVPESAINMEIGMITSNMTLFMRKKYDVRNKETVLLANSLRPIALRHTSFPIRLAYEFCMAPWLMLGFVEETQSISIQMFEDFRGHPELVVSHLETSLVSAFNEQLEVYQASIRFQVPLHGIRYFMYYWFLSSSAVTTTIFCMGNMITMLIAGAVIFHYVNTLPSGRVVEEEPVLRGNNSLRESNRIGRFNPMYELSSAVDVRSVIEKKISDEAKKGKKKEETKKKEEDEDKEEDDNNDKVKKKDESKEKKAFDPADDDDDDDVDEEEEEEGGEGLRRRKTGKLEQQLNQIGYM